MKYGIMNRSEVEDRGEEKMIMAIVPMLKRGIERWKSSKPSKGVGA